MKCTFIETGEGRRMIICGPRKKEHRCEYCGSIATFQCDQPVVRNGKKRTCDSWVCGGCRVSIGPDLDLCVLHGKQYRENGEKFAL